MKALRYNHSFSKISVQWRGAGGDIFSSFIYFACSDLGFVKFNNIREAQHKRMYHKSILIWSSFWSLLTCDFHLINTFISKKCDENVHLNVFHLHVHRNDSCQCFKNFNCSKHTNGLFSR